MYILLGQEIILNRRNGVSFYKVRVVFVVIHVISKTAREL